MLKSLLDWAPAAGAALVALAIGLAAGAWHGKALGKEEARTEAALEAVGRINNMEKNNAGFQKLPARERCRIFMRDSGLPAETCDQRQWVPDDPVR